MADQLATFLKQRAQQKQSLTLVTGVFDLLHEEHLHFLQKAKKTADLLLVGLESDRRVKQIKGANRPINDQHQRLLNLQKLAIADFIFILPENFSTYEEHRQLIARIRPDFMAISSNTAFQDVKKRILAEFGGQLLIVHDFNPDWSSSKLIAQLELVK